MMICREHGGCYAYSISYNLYQKAIYRFLTGRGNPLLVISFSHPLHFLVVYLPATCNFLVVYLSLPLAFFRTIMYIIIV